MLAEVLHRVPLRKYPICVHDAASQVEHRLLVTVAVDIVHDVLDDVEVRLHPQGSEQHEQRDVHPHVMDVAPDEVTVLVRVGRVLEDRQFWGRKHVVRDGADFCHDRKAVVLVAGKDERLVLATPILRDDALLRAVDNEVREHVILALVLVVEKLGQHGVGDAVARPDHDRDHADANVLEHLDVVYVRPVLAELRDVSVNVCIQRAAVREVSQTGLLWRHDLGATVFLGDHRSCQNGILHVYVDDETVLLQLFVEFRLHLDGVEAVDDVFHVVENEIVERLDLVAHELLQAASGEQRIDDAPCVTVVFDGHTWDL